MVVPLSVNRLPLLEGTCVSWGGPLSAAVYVARLPAAAAEGEAPAVSSAKRQVRELFDR